METVKQVNSAPFLRLHNRQRPILETTYKQVETKISKMSGIMIRANHQLQKTKVIVSFQSSIEEERQGTAQLPTKLREIKSKYIFKKEMKHFAQQQYDSDLEKP